MEQLTAAAELAIANEDSLDTWPYTQSFKSDKEEEPKCEQAQNDVPQSKPLVPSPTSAFDVPASVKPVSAIVPSASSAFSQPSPPPSDDEATVDAPKRSVRSSVARAVSKSPSTTKGSAKVEAIKQKLAEYYPATRSVHICPQCKQVQFSPITHQRHLKIHEKTPTTGRPHAYHCLYHDTEPCTFSTNNRPEIVQHIRTLHLPKKPTFDQYGAVAKSIFESFEDDTVSQFIQICVDALIDVCDV